jgi:hypothetical protein
MDGYRIDTRDLSTTAEAGGYPVVLEPALGRWHLAFPRLALFFKSL